MLECKVKSECDKNRSPLGWHRDGLGTSGHGVATLPLTLSPRLSLSISLSLFSASFSAIQFPNCDKRISAIATLLKVLYQVLYHWKKWMYLYLFRFCPGGKVRLARIWNSIPHQELTKVFMCQSKAKNYYMKEINIFPCPISLDYPTLAEKLIFAQNTPRNKCINNDGEQWRSNETRRTHDSHV